MSQHNDNADSAGPVCGQAEASLRRLNEELARAAKLKDEFMASMSHELRTPLTGILNLSEALQEGVYGPLAPEQATALRTIEESGRHLLNLINDILDLSKIGAGQLALQLDECNVEKLCQASWLLLRGLAARKNLRYQFSIFPPHLSLLADIRRLKQMLVNLLGNAVKFTPPGGEVGLEVRGISSIDPGQRVGTDTMGEVRFCVWDTGIGIPADKLNEIFRPFTQVDSSLARHYEGSGLGLALAQGMAELHHGRIEVESAPGQGSRFTLVLPWRLPVPRPSGNYLGAPDCPGGHRVLVVDEGRAGGDDLARYLRDLGIVHTVNRTGQGVVEQAASLLPCLVLLDIAQPGQDGRAVLAELKSDPRTRAIPLIVAGLADGQAYAYAQGAAAYLLKPFNLADVRLALEHGLQCLLACDKPPGLAARFSGPSPLLLLVEDNDLLARSYVNYLERRGYRLSLAHGGEQALALAAQTPPDLILMDIHMPGMNGLEAIQRLRVAENPRLAGVPIIALTGLAMPGDQERCLAAGADAYLSKPVSLKQLSEVIASRLAGQAL